LGQGSTFSFDIPLYQTPLRADPEANQKVIGLEPGRSTPKVLIVDDRAENRLVLTRLLGPLGFHMAEAEDGVEAVQVCAEWHPDVVLMDIRMPRMDGFEALRHIRALPLSPGIIPPAVIALTASAFDHDHEAMLRAGFDDHVGKPFKEVDLFLSLTRTRGLRFIHETTSPKGQANHAKTEPGCLAGMSSTWFAAFQMGLDTGDREEVVRLLAEVCDPDLAAELQAMARAYRFEELARLSKEAPPS
jgi:CheY-like chemotaxis protein